MIKQYVSGRRRTLSNLWRSIRDTYKAMQADATIDRLWSVDQAQHEVGRLYHYVPLATAVTEDDAILALKNIEQTFRWPFKPREVQIYFCTVKHLRRLRRV